MLISLLDNDNGINNDAFKLLCKFAHDSNNTHITRAAKCQDNRWYISENIAAQLRLDIK